ncbi:MAG TPA: RNA pseudouridine synthase [Phnomibacter sp.]|nr:RNA pseudouridine synthase [Phnomibacter sp.]
MCDSVGVSGAAVLRPHSILGHTYSAVAIAANGITIVNSLANIAEASVPNADFNFLCSMHLPAPTIIASTNNWIAVNKPSGLLSIQDRHQHDIPSVRSWLEKQFGTVYVVHRIDKDTSGLILFAKNETTHKYLSQLFENRQIQKKYLGLVHGTPYPADGTVDAPIAEHSAKNGTMIVHARGKHAVTHYHTLQALGKYSLLEFDIETGRTHQIRVHAKHIGHPIVADVFYSDGRSVFLSDFKKKVKLSKLEEEERPMLDRLGLHAHTLAFKDEDGTTVSLEAPLFKDMKALISQLEKNAR